MKIEHAFLIWRKVATNLVQMATTSYNCVEANIIPGIQKDTYATLDVSEVAGQLNHSQALETL